ncbi:MAG TPA: hypothetical protein VLL54_20635 [Pyrinomonadaceae bacterium]|nr:hypothetical protein [Pyrinomonadaceae bacterium]
MSATLKFKQSNDLNPRLMGPRLDGAKLIGRWLNTNRNSKGLAECSITAEGEHYNIRLTGAGKDAPVKWPQAKTAPMVNLEEEANQRSVALTADFEFDFMKAETHIRVNRGVLVIVLFITFTDESGRSNYVNREFFYRED